MISKMETTGNYTITLRHFICIGDSKKEKNWIQIHKSSINAKPLVTDPTIYLSLFCLKGKRVHYLQIGGFLNSIWS